MASAYHGCEFLALAVRLERFGGKGSNAPFPDKGKRGFPSLRLGQRPGTFTVRLVDPCGIQGLLDAPFAIAPPEQRCRFGTRKGRIVDIAKISKLFGEFLDRRLALFRPSALPQFAREISTQLGAGGRIAPYIRQRELLKPLAIQRWTGFLRVWPVMRHLCAIVEPPFDRQCSCGCILLTCCLSALSQENKAME